MALLVSGEGKKHATSTFEVDGAFSYAVGKSRSMAPRAESQFHLEDKASGKEEYIGLCHLQHVLLPYG
jgi:hypothetical protein